MNDLTTDFVDAINGAIDSTLQKAFDRHMEAFKAEAENIRAEVIAGAVMKISEWYSYQDMGKTIRIEVQRPEPRREPAEKE